MHELNVLIVEDEMIIAKDVAAHLEEMGLQIAGVKPSGEEAISFLRNTKVDFVLMDIALSGHLDGIETSTIIKSRSRIPIVFMTANTDDATFERAKQTTPFAFIEKPFKKRTLIRTIELLIEKIFQDGDKKQDAFLLQDRIFVKEKNALVKISLKDVHYLGAERAYCKIVTEEKTFILSSPLGALEKKIASGFLRRIHRSYIVNISKIDRIEDGFVSVGTANLPVSKSYWEDLSRSLQIL